MTAMWTFLRDNAPWLGAGALLAFLSSFGQTFFIAIFAGEIRADFGLSNGQWGGIYSLGTGASALAMLAAGPLADRFRVRVLGIAVIALLALACVAMAGVRSATGLVFVIFALRFLGQGMASHVSLVAMVRWFVATRGRALAVATVGFSLGEATMPLSFVWLKQHADWQVLWLWAAGFCLCMLPVLALLLRRERTPQSASEGSHSPGLDGRHWTRGQALRLPLFWALVPAVVMIPTFSTAFWFHQVQFTATKGWDHLSFVAILPLGTATYIASTFLFGGLLDRVGSARLLPVYLIPFALAFVLHWAAPTLGWTALGVVLMGLSGGGQATLPAACWAEFYGTRHIGAIKSAVAALMVLGSALGPGITGWLIDAGVPLPTQWIWAAGLIAASAALTVLPLARARGRLPRSLPVAT